MPRLRLNATLAIGLLVVAGCRRHEDDPLPPDPNACRTDADCAPMDDGDTCFATPRCDVATMQCVREFLQNETDCQCTFWPHCRDLGYDEMGCNEITCDVVTHQCGEIIAPAGIAPRPRRGDCTEVFCDGTSREGMPELEPEDEQDDGNTCTVDMCDANELGTTTHTPLADGATCLDGSGLCYAARCYPGCIPDDAESCGAEGEMEPFDDSAETSNLVAGTTSCGMLDVDDEDWIRKRLDDESFVMDVLRIEVHASAPEVELCAYIQCRNHASGGRPAGGCSSMSAGPVAGSFGCCWQGPPETLRPEWDLNCTDTDEDSGTLWLKVRAIGGDACDTYTMSFMY